MDAKIISYTRDRKGKVVNRRLKDLSNTLHTGSGTTVQNLLDTLRVKHLLRQVKQMVAGMRNNTAQVTLTADKTIRAYATDKHGRNFGMSEWRVQYENNSSDTITTAHQPKIYGMTTNYRIRKFTPRECFRLMDVAETDIDKIQAAGISKSQQYKMAGNSIVVNVLFHIFRKMFTDTGNDNRFKQSLFDCISNKITSGEYNTKHPLRVFTAFSGYDSQCLALDKLTATDKTFAYELVGWSEIDKYAIQAHNAVFPFATTLNQGDISKIDWETIPDFDLFTYSFPCTDISSAGLRKGLSEGSGTRSGLLWECRKAIETKHPRFLLMENVAALAQKKFMPEFRNWQAYLETQGYTNFWQILNSKDYGVPQNRARVFMVSMLDKNTTYHFPSPFPLERRIRDILEKNVDESYYVNPQRLGKLEIKEVDV